MSNRVVKVTSYWYVWQADFARARLATHGIPACLGNAGLLSWFWYYGNAVGGVTLHVSQSDAERACDVLWPDRGPAPEQEPSWKCAGCGERLEGAWEVCWNCGTSFDFLSILLETSWAPFDPH